MRKFVTLLLCIVFAASGCKNDKPAGYTVLGEFTPYGGYPEKITGKVEKIVEKNYWGIPGGESFLTGKPITLEDRDTLTWTNDFEAIFDSDGDLVSCSTMDENGKTLTKWVLSKTNGKLASGEYYLNDTLNYNAKFSCNENGDIIEEKIYRPVVDTLVYTFKTLMNSSDDPAEIQQYNYQDVLIRKYLLKYDSENRFSGRETYNGNGGLMNSSSITYNDQGKWAELTFYDKDRKVAAENYFTYEYDKDGNWIKAIVKDSDGHVVIEERNYSYLR